MPGGNKRRDDIAYGRGQSEDFTDRGIELFNPFLQTGNQAQNVYASAFGIGGQPQPQPTGGARAFGPVRGGPGGFFNAYEVPRATGAQAPGLAGINRSPVQQGAAAQGPSAAYEGFRNSDFYRGGELAFQGDRDAIDSGLANQGLAFSGARMSAVEDARNRNFSNAFNQYLAGLSGIANQGFSAAGAQSELLNAQANRAIGAAGQTAGTRQGALGTIGQATQIAGNFG